MLETVYPHGARRDIEKYEEEKALGIRQSNGQKTLTRLTRQHLEIIDLHIEGEKGRAIAEKLGIHVSKVYQTLNDPLAQEAINQATEAVKAEFGMLFGKVTDAIRDGLGEENGLETRLKAVDRYAKVKQVQGEVEKGETAEDVVQRILQLNIQVNTNGNSQT